MDSTCIHFEELGEPRQAKAPILEVRIPEDLVPWRSHRSRRHTAQHRGGFSWIHALCIDQCTKDLCNTSLSAKSGF